MPLQASRKAVVLTADAAGIRRAARAVAEGGVVVFPTDTVYGLGCNPFNREAVRRLLHVKGKRDKALPILVSSARMALKIALLNRVSKQLIRSFWPGPLTLVLALRRPLPVEVTSGGKSVGLRCPDSRLTRDFIKACGGFLVGTSANLTGSPPCTSADQALKKLGDLVDAIIDGGRSPRSRGSTVVEVTQDRLIVLRKGPIARRDLLRAVTVQS